MILNMVGGGSGGGGGIPEFSYTGLYELLDDSTTTGNSGDWRIKLKTSGTLRFSKLGNGNGSIDVFCVGGGGGAFRAGGGGGYTKTQQKTIAQDTDYAIQIGAGGSGVNSGSAVAGGNTTAFGVTAGGGKAPVNDSYGTVANGGSGGGTKGQDSTSGSAGGTDGSDGVAYNSAYPGGKGQISTPGSNGETGSTREFGESSGTLYSNGGAGAGGVNYAPEDGAANTGNGGKGGWTVTGGSGGSGIVVIRNHRGA